MAVERCSHFLYGAAGLLLGTLITHPGIFVKARRLLQHIFGSSNKRITHGNTNSSRRSITNGGHHHQHSNGMNEDHLHVTENGFSDGRIKPDPFSSAKREGAKQVYFSQAIHRYLSWDDYFMAIAFLSAHRSKDPNRQVGACLVSQDRVILGIGYNGFPRGCSDDKLPWAKKSATGDPLETKYPYVCHAEVNAILNKNHASAYGQRLYVTMFPCNECAKIIIQAGVAEVVYFIAKNLSECTYAASKKLLTMAGVKVWQHQPRQEKIILEFK